MTKHKGMIITLESHEPPLVMTTWTHVAIQLDGTLRPSPMPGISHFDGQVFYRKKQGK